ncbi:hypothetical protein ABTY61_15790 [Kitasatospora sp. NPDC096128]|uniref:hypothetical protein n=1 Tax=Kitasatospora sp. NPDC096128 TaxID=3155547 RepID=UPI003323A5DD
MSEATGLLGAESEAGAAAPDDSAPPEPSEPRPATAVDLERMVLAELQKLVDRLRQTGGNAEFLIQIQKAALAEHT